MDKLSSCPFCGNEDIEISADKITENNPHIWCSKEDCGEEMFGEKGNKKIDLIKKWNRRVYIIP